ncbi:MAG: helix-turn-helix domain-containing protein [Patescibacteria group bacterium]
MLGIYLAKLGLPKNTTKVFESLLLLGETKASDIIKKTGLHRHLVYEALKDLEARGLAKRLVRNDVAHFRILSADPLIKEAEDRYAAATEIARLLREKKEKIESTVTFFEGVEGVNAFTELVLAQGQDLDVLGGNARFRQFYSEIFDHWNDRRIEKKIRFRVLAPNEVTDAHLYGAAEVIIRRYDARLFPGVVWIFGDYLAHIVWKTKQNTEIILIKQPDLAEQHRELFSALWKVAK